MQNNRYDLTPAVRQNSLDYDNTNRTADSGLGFASVMTAQKNLKLLGLGKDKYAQQMSQAFKHWILHFSVYISGLSTEYNILIGSCDAQNYEIFLMDEMKYQRFIPNKK